MLRAFTERVDLKLGFCARVTSSHLNRLPTGVARRVRSGIFPIGVETAQLSRLARRAAQAPFVRDVMESLADRVMIIGVDRLDYSKGIALRMEAFDRFLSTMATGEGR